MDSQIVRTTLGELQEDPDRKDLWQSLTDAVRAQDGDLSPSDALRLLASARRAHRDRGEVEAVASMLGVEVSVARGSEAEPELLREQARVHSDGLFDEDGAALAWLRLQELDPNDPRVSVALTEIEDRRGRAAQMAETYAAEARETTDPVYKSSMAMRAAEMRLRFAANGEDLGVAIEGLRAALAADPSNAAAARMLERALRRQERWEEVAALLDQVAARPEDTEEATRAALRLARVRDKRLGDSAGAAAAWSTVLRLVPSHPDAMSYLSAYYSREERWDDLVALYERDLVSIDHAGPERLGDMLQIAMLHWRMRQQPVAALPWFEKIRKLEPTHEGMLQYYRDYSAATGDEARLLNVLQSAQRVLHAGPQKDALGEEIAALAQAQKDAQKDIERHKSVLRDNPDDAESREALKLLYRKTQGYNALVELLRQQLERTDEANTAERLGILYEIATVYREFVRSDTALLSVLNQIVQLDERAVPAIRELVGLYERLGRWRDLLANQRRLADATEDRREKADLLRQLGHRWLDQFSNVQNAMQAYEALLEVDPSDAQAREQLRDLYKKRRAWPQLYALCEAELSVVTGEQRVAVLREMAQLAAERVNRPEEAIKLYRQILDEAPDDLQVLDALEKQAERSRDWPILAEALERRAGSLDGEARVAVLQKLGGVYAEQMADPARASTAWRRVLDVQPGHPRALRVLRDTYLGSADYAGLEELYASQNDWEGLADVLSNAADRAKDVAAKIDLSYRAAAVYVERLHQPDRALRSYERILASDPQDARAAALLVPLYEAEEKWARLPPLYELLCGHAQATEEKLVFLRRLVEVTSKRLADKQAGLAYAKEAFELAPDDPEVGDLLEEACRNAGTWDPILSALEARLAKVKKAKKRRPHQLRLAGIYAKEVGRVDDAVPIYRELLEAEPSDQATRNVLADILRREDRRADLRWLLDLEVGQAPDDVARMALLNDWARLEEQSWGELARAAELHVRMLELEPGHELAVQSAARLLLATDQVERAVELLDSHREAMADPLRAPVEAQLATLYLERLDQPTQALAAAERALVLLSHHPEALAVLERLVERPETRERAASLLASEYAEAGDARREATALAAMLSVVSNRQERLTLHGRLVDVYEQKLDGYDRALEALLQATREFPEHLDLWERAGSLAALCGGFKTLADAYRDVVAQPLPEELAVELCRQAAALHEDKLGDPLGAAPYLERVLLHEPHNAAAFARLKQILTGAEQWDQLESLYDKAAAITEDPVRRAEMLAEVAMIAEEVIESNDKAIRYYERILEIEAAHEQAMRALDRLYEAQERYGDLASLIERRMQLMAGADLLAMRQRLATVRLERLGQPEAAMPHVEDLLQERPNDYEARTLAEKLLALSPTRERAARVLEPVYEARDEIRNLVGVLKVRLDALDARVASEGLSVREALDERKDLLRRIATLLDERLRDDEGAFDMLGRYVPLDPLDEDARDRLLEIGGRLGAHGRLAAILGAAAEAAETTSLKGEILMRVARLYEEELAQPAEAEATYRKVLEMGSDDPEIVLPAARALERVYTAAAEPQKLASMLRTQIRLEEEGQKRSELRRRLGTLCEDVLEDPAGAIEAWQARLDEEPGDAAALAALDRLYEKTEAWSKLVEVLRTRKEQSESPSLRRELAQRSAAVYADKLGAPREAIDVWRSIVDEFGADLESLSALEALFSATEAWQDLAETLETHLELVGAEAPRLDLLARLGDLRRTRLDDVNRALDSYREALTMDATHQASRAALEELLGAADALVRRDAAEILHPIFDADGDNERLLRVIDIEIETADDPEQKLDAIQSAVRVADAALGDRERAFGYVMRGLREAAGHAPLRPWTEELERLAALTGKRKEQVQLLAEIVDSIFDGDVQFETTSRMAELARTELGDAERAKEYYRKALQQRPDDQGVLMALESLHDAAGDTASLLETLERRAEVAEGDAERKALMFRRAELLASRLGDPAQAIDVYRSILDIDMDPRAVEALESLYGATQRWEDLMELYQRQLDEPGAAVAALRVKIGRVAARHVGDLSRAVDELEGALEADRGNEAAIQELERLLEQPEPTEHRSRAAELLEPIYLVRADYDRVMGTLRTRLEKCEDPDQRRELLTRLMSLYEEQKEDYAAALETAALLLADDPSNTGTVAEVERLAKVADAELRLADIYAAQLAKVDLDDEHTTRLAARAGEIYASAGQDEKALELLGRALRFQPESDHLFEAVDRLLEKLGRLPARVEHYRAGMEHRFEPATRLRFLHTIAGLYRGPLSNVDAAIETYREALDVDDQDATTLDALTGLYRERERWNDLAELYLRRAEAAEEPRAGAEYRLALARLYREQLADTGRAIEQLEEIVATQPDFGPAIKELEALREDDRYRERVVEILRPLYEGSDDWRRLVHLNEDRFKMAQDAVEKVAVLRETAELWEERGKDLVRARRALAVALEMGPDDDELRLHYERLVAATDAWLELTDKYEAILEDHPELSNKREFLATLAQTHDLQRDDPRRALEVYQQLWAADPSEIEPVEHVERLATLLSDWKVLDAVLVAKADMVFDDAARAALWRRVAEGRRDSLGDAAGAIDAFEKAVELEPENSVTLDGLIELLEAAKRAERLVEVYERRVELMGEGESQLRYEMLLQAAKTYEAELQNRPRAIDMLSQALVVRPGEPEVLSALARLYEAEQLWSDLLENLRLQAGAAADAAERTRLRRRIAEILCEQEQAHEEALEVYRLVLDEAPTDEGAVAAVRKIGAEHEGLRDAVADILVPVFRTTEQPERLVEVLEMRLTAEEDPVKRAGTLSSIAEVLERSLSRPSDALTALLRALVEQPSAPDLHMEAERLARATGAWGAYADRLAELAQGAFDGDLARDLHERLARISEVELEDDRRAVKAYEGALEHAGDRVELLDALDRLYERLGDYEALAKILERRADLAQSEREQADLFHRLAVVQIRHQSSTELGLASLRQALDRIPGHEGATQVLESLTDDRVVFEQVAELLEGIYRGNAQSVALAALYDKRVAHAQGAQERVVMRRDLARVLEEDAGDVKGAQRALQLALQDDPGEPGLLAEIERLAAITGDWEGAAAALSRTIEESGRLSSEQGRELSLRLACWQRDKMEDVAAAERSLQQALGYDAESDEALAQLEALQNGAGREKDLVATLRRRAKLSVDAQAREEFYRRAVDLALRAGERQLAEDVLRELLDFDRTNLWGLAELTELRRASGDYKETFELLGRRAELVAEEAPNRQLRLEAARLARGELGDTAAAIDLFRGLFEDRPTDTESAAALRELLAKAERFEELLRLLERLLDVTDLPSERSPLRLEMARLEEGRFRRPDRAIELLGVVLEEEPGRTDAVVELCRIYEATQRNDDLATLLTEQIEAALGRGDHDAELSFRVRLGEVCEGRLHDPVKAIETYRTVLERDPVHRGALQALIRLHQSRGEHREAAASVSKLLSVSEGDERRRLAVVLADEHEALGEPAEVASSLEIALAVEPQHPATRERLRKLYEKMEAWEKLAGLIEGDAAAEESQAAKVKLYRAAATLHAERRGDKAAAASALEKALEAQPEDRDLMLELCDAYSACGRGKAAVDVLQKIVESYGGKRSKELAEIHRRLAKAHLSDGDRTRAVEELEKAFRIEPGNVGVLYELGSVAMDAGDMQKAQQMFRALLLQKLETSTLVSKAEVFYRLGLIHHRLGEKPKAVQNLKRAVQQDASLSEAQALLQELEG